jgi:hypothetical protein
MRRAGRIAPLGQQFAGHPDARLREVISVSPRSSTFVDLLGPPVEARRRADTVGLALEHSTMGELRIFEVLNRGKVAVDERRIGQRP